METLQLKEISGYLAYGLKVIWNNTYIGNAISMYVDYDLIDIEFDYGVQRHSIKDVKLCLKPMSAIIDPLPDGTMPIVELSKIEGFMDTSDVNYKLSGYNGAYGVRYDIRNDDDDSEYEVFGWDQVYGFGVHYRPSMEWRCVGNQHLLFDYLHKRMFDYRGLIQRGLAIDLNSVKEK